MNKKSFCIITAVLLLFAVLILGGCNGSSDGSKGKHIVMNMSAEAKAYTEQMMPQKARLQEKFMEQMTNENSLICTRAGAQTFPSDVETTHTFTVSECMGENVYTALPDTDYDKIVIYIHGGSFIYEIDQSHIQLCDSLIDLLNAKVIVPLYPLVPQVKWQAQYEMLAEVYKEALRENKPVILMGDSAGAVLAFGLALQFRQDGTQPPSKIILLSPVPDVTLSNEEAYEYESKDVLIGIDTTKASVKLWAGETDLTDWHLSVINGDCKGLADTLIFIGNCEVFYPDTVLLFDKLIAAGNNATLVTGNGLQHVFPTCSAPEFEQSLVIIKNFVEGK